MSSRAARLTCKMSPCKGASKSLVPADCAAWGDIFNATNGGQWTGCSNNRLDPCGCTDLDPSGDRRVSCNDGKTISGLNLDNNKCSGTIPASVGKFSQLNFLRFQNNQVRVRVL